MVILCGLSICYKQIQKRKIQEATELFREQIKILEEYDTELPQIKKMLKHGDYKNSILRLECIVERLHECKAIPIWSNRPLEGERILVNLYKTHKEILNSSIKSQKLNEYLHTRYPDFDYDIGEKMEPPDMN